MRGNSCQVWLAVLCGAVVLGGCRPRTATTTERGFSQTPPQVVSPTVALKRFDTLQPQQVGYWPGDLLQLEVENLDFPYRYVARLNAFGHVEILYRDSPEATGRKGAAGKITIGDLERPLVAQASRQECLVVLGGNRMLGEGSLIRILSRNLGRASPQKSAFQEQRTCLGAASRQITARDWDDTLVTEGLIEELSDYFESVLSVDYSVGWFSRTEPLNSVGKFTDQQKRFLAKRCHRAAMQAVHQGHLRRGRSLMEFALLLSKHVSELTGDDNLRNFEAILSANLVVIDFQLGFLGDAAEQVVGDAERTLRGLDGESLDEGTRELLLVRIRVLQAHVQFESMADPKPIVVELLGALATLQESDWPRDVAFKETHASLLLAIASGFIAMFQPEMACMYGKKAVEIFDAEVEVDAAYFLAEVSAIRLYAEYAVAARRYQDAIWAFKHGEQRIKDVQPVLGEDFPFMEVNLFRVREAALLVVQKRYEKARQLCLNVLDSIGDGVRDQTEAATEALILLGRMPGRREDAQKYLLEAGRIVRTANHRNATPTLKVKYASALIENIRASDRRIEEKIAEFRRVARDLESLPRIYEVDSVMLECLWYQSHLISAGGGDPTESFEEMRGLLERFPEEVREYWRAEVLWSEATVRLARGEYGRARELCLAALAKFRSELPPGHAKLGRAQWALFHCYAGLGERDAAWEALLAAVRMQVEFDDQVVLTSAEAQALSYLAETRFVYDDLVDQALQLGRDEGEVAELIWRRYGIVLRSLIQQRQAVLKADSLTASTGYQYLRAVRAQLSQLAFNRRFPREQTMRLMKHLTREKEKLERELSGTLPDFRDARLVKPLAALQKRLASRSAFVQLMQYRRWLGPGVRRESRYAALVVTRDRRELVDLGAAAELDPVVEQWRKQLVGELPAGGEEPAAVLSQRVWNPIEAVLSAAATGPAGESGSEETIETVYVAPEGKLARISWAALPDAAGELLLERYAFATVPAGHVLLDRLGDDPAPPPTPRRGWLAAVGALFGAENAASPEPAEGPAAKGETPAKMTPSKGLLVGDVDYNQGQSSDGEISEALLGRVVYRSHRVAGLEAQPWQGWAELPGTSEELRRIQDLVPQEHIAVELRGDAATVEGVLQHLPDARWAHLATHGFFSPSRMQSLLQAARPRELPPVPRLGYSDYSHSAPWERSPLLLSGLVFAGANRVSEESEAAGDPYRGVLTGEALVALPLQDLELVVLSACDTGLGEVAAGEGVLGLQRAFHLAGARNVIASLWKVDDRQVVELMVRFYEHLWTRGRTPLQALRHAQLDMVHRGRNVSGTRRGIDPGRVERLPGDEREKARRLPAAHWAGFVISGPGDWR